MSTNGGNRLKPERPAVQRYDAELVGAYNEESRKGMTEKTKTKTKTQRRYVWCSRKVHVLKEV